MSSKDNEKDIKQDSTTEKNLQSTESKDEDKSLDSVAGESSSPTEEEIFVNQDEVSFEHVVGGNYQNDPLDPEKEEELFQVQADKEKIVEIPPSEESNDNRDEDENIIQIPPSHTEEIEDDDSIFTPEQAASEGLKQDESIEDLPSVKVFHPTKDSSEVIDEMKNIVPTEKSNDESSQAKEEPLNRREARKQRREEKRQNAKGPIRYIPVWLRLIIVIALCLGALVIGLMVGYTLIGDGEDPQSILRFDFWRGLLDYIQGK